MLNLNQLDIDINFALNAHKIHMCNFIQDKLDKLSDNANPNYVWNELLKEFIEGNTDNSVENIITNKHDKLREIQLRFSHFVDSKSQTHFKGEDYSSYINTQKEDKPSKTNIHKFFLRVENVFSYKTFGNSNYSKYKLTENLKVRTCVYCNRMYAITHYKSDGSNLMNPQLDHWLPKSKYPLLQVSFFNLIPSCDICNTRIKKVREFEEDNHVHPYDDDYMEIKFTYLFDQTIDNFKVVFENDGITPNKVRDTFEFLYVHEMYNAHIPDLEDLIKIKKVYGDTYLEKLKESFPAIDITVEDRFRLAFGVEMDPKKFHLNPLSKFKHDILKELKII